jgi:hypothetical protein
MRPDVFEPTLWADSCAKREMSYGCTNQPLGQHNVESSHPEAAQIRSCHLVANDPRLANRMASFPVGSVPSSRNTTTLLISPCHCPDVRTLIFPCERSENVHPRTVVVHCRPTFGTSETILWLRKVPARLVAWQDLGCPESCDVTEFHNRAHIAPELFRKRPRRQRIWYRMIRTVLAGAGMRGARENTPAARSACRHFGPR